MITGTIAAIILLTFLLLRIWVKRKATLPPVPITKPLEEVPNDKLVLIRNSELEQVKQAIEQFCTLYNQDGYVALPRMAVMENDEYFVTFPFDIDFERLCYFVNYLYYPENFKHHPEVLAWTSPPAEDDWITDELSKKKIMLYVPSDDKEYDNVFLTTASGKGYKIGFSSGPERLDSPARAYLDRPDIDLKSAIRVLEFE